MNIDLQNLPLDAVILQKIIIALSSENQTLQEQLNLLRAKYFGKSSEKLKKQISDLEDKIEDNEIESSKDGSAEKSAPNPKTKADNKNSQKPKRKKLPDDLPREENILNPDPECPSCGGTDFRQIGEDCSELLEYIKSSLKVI
ncbi:MAG: hypothetical protein NWP61_01385, partial [Rickettsiaceae bacterium]|nr:hypothetical protein [Rickettsiaceae bacterium]